MSERFFAEWERRVQETAVSFPYPPTPDVSRAVRQRLVTIPPRRMAVRRRAVWAVALVLLVLGGLLAVPPVRAAVWRMIRAGAITIFVSEPPPTSTPSETAVPPSPTPPPINEFIFDLATPITLAEAQVQVRVPLKLPGYPDDLGAPDRVYRQESTWPPTIVFVWLEPERPDVVRMSLYHIEADNYAYKGAENIEPTTVNGQDAFWLEAPHYFQLQDGQFEPWLFVEGSVLIWWTDEGVTYRLESGLPLAEARRIAESVE